MRRGSPTCLLLPLLALVLLAGCSRGPEGAAPTSSTTAPSIGGPVFIANPRSHLDTPHGATTEAVTFTTMRITAAEGGSVQLGRFSVEIPAGALAGDTDITVRDPGNWFVSCELEPHGIQFLVPVELQIDLHGLDYNPYRDWNVYWLAPEGQWQDEGGTFANEKLRTTLWHFSDYAPGFGRAGW